MNAQQTIADGGDEPSPTIAAPAVRIVPKRQSRRLDLLMLVAAAVAVGGTAFAVGRVSAPAVATDGGAAGIPAAAGAAGAGAAGASFAPGGPGANGTGGAPGGSTTVSGTVTAIDGSTMTITTTGGATVTVAVDGSTAYHAQASASPGVITSGSSVQVQLQGAAAGAAPAGGGPAASAAAAASGAPVASPGAATLTATDVTLVSQ